MKEVPACFIPFDRRAEQFSLPEKFTFPFYYEPHPLALHAAESLKTYLTHQRDFDHNFGLDATASGLVIGKMFGVLVVRNESGQLGYLQAFSGKLANGNHHEGFVPPVFDMLTDGSFYREGELEVNNLTLEIEQLELREELLNARNAVKDLEAAHFIELKRLKQEIKAGKKVRDAQRKAAATLSLTEQSELLEELRKASMREQYFLKDFQRDYQQKLASAREKLAELENALEAKREARRNLSNSLQQRLFENYHFLNVHGERKSLLDIFVKGLNISPPAGSGECAAPKLLHYAFLYNMEPIAMAEFWWGASPASEVRKHGTYYPACRGKCEPILGHMLQGLQVDENPLLSQPLAPKELDIVYEDDSILVVNKPAEFLSVPGINLKDSVYTRAKELYPHATGPMIVHRLDMSTSGILLLTKTEKAYQKLQRQFIKRKVKKRYVALLAGEVLTDSGTIDLPLRVDLDDRPRQLVCYDHGKRAVTEFEVVERADGRTRIHFYPITGRTHQLRVHASHSLGLNAPIIGDDLYGTKANRLHLHAEMLEIIHPETGEVQVFKIPPSF